eukprot:1219480-Heterocapsa_arctica.AAC.1
MTRTGRQSRRTHSIRVHVGGGGLRYRRLTASRIDCAQPSLGLGYLTHAVHLLLDIRLDDVTVVVVPI